MYRSDSACQELVAKMAPHYDYEGLNKQYQEAKVKWDAEMLGWKAAAEQAKKDGKEAPRPPRGPQSVGKAGEINYGKMGSLFESYIRPYVGYAIRGVLWDQGESKTNVACVDQVTLMGALIKGWRKEWGQDFPFLYVQKPSGGGTAWDLANPINAQASKFSAQPAAVPPGAPEDYSYELHLKIMNVPNTFMVTSTDLGAGIHPVLKSAYGERGAYVAMGSVYGAQQQIYGPLFGKHQVEGNKVRIQYTHVGKGLEARHADKLQGFLIAGSDRKFQWADAVIDGDTVVVSSPSVPNPESVRYAWSSNFPWANLFNKDGLPAQPFRTDNW
jgi:sialate O-acetylesterase